MASKKKEYKGKNIDEAIALACKDCDASQNELDIEVITTGSAGIFGFGRKKAVIIASRKATPQESGTDAEPMAPGKRHHGKKAKDSTLASVRIDDDATASGAEKPRRHEARSGGSGHEMPAARPKRQGSAKREQGGAARFDDGPSLPPTQDALDQIKDMTQTILRLMGVQAEVTMTVDGPKVAVHILGGGDHDVIVGRDGSTLDALQYLLRKIVSQKFPEKIAISLDAGTYREERQRELEQLALELAQKVKETGKSQMISALNPAERRLVHVVLQDDTAIRSASIGEGLFKKVRIYLPGKGRKRSGRSGGDPSGQEV